MVQITVFIQFIFQSVLQKILQEIDWCTNNAYSQDLTDNIGRCILKAAKLPCKNVASVSSNKNSSNFLF